jgi:hypothetical protein
MATPSSSGSSPISGTRVRVAALPDMLLEQVPGARATAAVCVQRPGGRRPCAASRRRFDLARASGQDRREMPRVISAVTRVPKELAR